MRFLISLGLMVIFFSLSFNEKSNLVEKTVTIIKKKNDSTKDQAAIQALIRQVLNWSNSKKSIDLLPFIADEKDSIYTALDINKLEKNLTKLRATNFFAAEFVNNYKRIVITLDKKLKSKELEPWLVGELPTFAFANDMDPWCLCQDVPYDRPNPWDLVTIEVIHLDSEKSELIWHWGKTKINTTSSWKKFAYKFRVVKENGKWKIAYLEGFDFNNSTKKE